MDKFLNATRRFLRDEEGVTAIEYGLIAALIAVAIVVGANALGLALNGIFTRLGACMATPNAATCALVV